jgi:hypothetical protein
MDKNFYMRPAPEKPEKIINMRREKCLDGLSGQEVFLFLLYLQDKGIDLNETYVAEEDGYSGTVVNLEYCLTETDEELAERIKKYKKELSQYNKWFKANKHNIHEWGLNRAEYLEKQKAKRIKQLKNELKELE